QESYKRLYPFVPTLESSSQEGDIVFVTGKPLLVLLSGKYNVIPYITGVNTEEGKLYVMDVIANETLWDEYEETLERFVPNDLGYAWGSSQSVAVAKKINKFYFNDRTLSNSSLSSLVDCSLAGDHFQVPMQNNAGGVNNDPQAPVIEYLHPPYLLVHQVVAHAGHALSIIGLVTWWSR
ncbi:unnamed protein product, partial [Timema podura]|nr:unnamed protein product [Timema podura]